MTAHKFDPFKAHRVTCSSDLPSACKHVLHVFIVHAGKDGSSYPGQTTIAKETGLALRGVWRATVDLVGLGVLDFERGGNGTPSRYTVRPSILASLTDNEITSCKSGKRESQTRNRRVSADTQPTRVSQDQTRNGRGPDTQPLQNPSL